MTMLERIQRLRELIQREESLKDLNYSARIMGELLESEVYIANKEGDILASGQRGDGSICPRHIHPSLRKWLFPVARPAINLALSHPVFKEFPEGENTILTIYPLILEGIFWGSLLLLRNNRGFASNELPIFETAALATGIILSRREILGRIREIPSYNPYFRDGQIHEWVSDAVYQVGEKTDEKVEEVW